MAASCPSPCQLVVKKAYENTIHTVISNVRDTFLDEGVDLEVLEKLRALWTSKMKASSGIISPETETDNSGDEHSKYFKGGDVYNLDSLSSLGCTSAVAVIGPDSRALVPIQIRLAGDESGVPRTIELEVRAALLQNNLLQVIMSKPKVKAILELPLENAKKELQKLLDLSQADLSPPSNLTAKRPAETSGGESAAVKPLNKILRSDGNWDDDDSENSSSDGLADDEDSYDEELLGPREEEIKIKYGEKELPDELVHDGEVQVGTGDFDDVQNVVVCTTEKIFRKGEKCTFHLRDGIMTLNGMDYVFLNAQGEAEF